MRREYLARLFDGVPGMIEVRPIRPDRGVDTGLRVFARLGELPVGVDPAAGPDDERGRSRAERDAVLEAVGGDYASPQRLLLVDDLLRLGLVLRGELMRWATANDSDSLGEVAGRVGSLVAARARVVGLLGLDAHRRELDLDRFLAQRAQAGRGEELEGAVEAEVVEGGDRGSSENLDAEPDREREETP
jgi:hypothetical protein